MRTFIIIFLLTLFYSCSNRQNGSAEIQKSDTIVNKKTFEISAIEASFPLRLTGIDLEKKRNVLYLNDGIVSKIEETIKEYASNIDFYDSTQTMKDTYINTICLHDSLQTIFLVLLKSYPTEEVTSKVLFYNNQKKQFADKVFDFNLDALYNFDNGKLKPTNLKLGFKINSPEIEILDFDKDGINDYKFVRLLHNGTFNEICTTILTVRNNKLDTLHFEKLPIGNEVFQKEKSKPLH